MLAQIYTGCQCGETYKVGIHTEIDTNKDEFYDIKYYTICGGNNLTEKMLAGVTCYHALTHEEIQQEIDLGKSEYDELDENGY